MHSESSCFARNAHFARAGVGLKPEHYRTVLETSPIVGFFEVHAENYMGAGGAPHRYLSAIRERYPLSIHGVGLSIGADGPLAHDHLQRLKHLVDRYQPMLVSEHLAWSTHDVGFLNDLLPVPYTLETLQRVANHIDEVQETLGRQILLENPSTYLAFAESTFSEADFIDEIVQRTGCALLLDVNNVLVASTNQGWDPIAYLDAYPMAHVRQIHLAGHLREADECGRDLLIDTHDRPVASDVWGLYGNVIGRIGPVPSLIEWDASVPAWPILIAETQQAETIMSETMSPRAERPHPGPASHAASRSINAEGLLQRSTGGDDESQAAFVKALLDPALATPANLVGPDGKPSVQRFNVYRNNVIAGLTSTLKDAYPVVTRIVGDEFFSAMARTYVATHLPSSPIMLDYGAEFVAFVGTFEPAIRSLPYLHDVARLERAWLEAYHALEASAIAMEELASYSAEDLMQQRVRLHPSIRVITSAFPVLTLWQTNIRDATPTWIDLNSGGQSVLVSRPAAEVEIRNLLPADVAFIEALQEGLCLLESTERALAIDTEFNLSANLVRLAEAGALIGLDNPSVGSIQ